MGGGGSLGKSESDSRTEGAFDQNVWSPQGRALAELYNTMGGLFGRTASGIGAETPSAVGAMRGVFDAAMPAYRTQLGGGAYADLDLSDAYRTALQGGGNEQFINESIMGGAGNNYVDAMRGQMQSDSDKRLGRSLALADLRAANAEQSGSSRHGLLQARLAEDEGDRLGDMQTRLGFETFDKDLDRKLDIARRADQFDIDRLGSIERAMAGKQGAMMGGLNFGPGMQNLGMGRFAPYMAPWQAAGQYASAIGRPTVLGSGTTYGDSSSKGFGMSGYGGYGK